MAGPRPAITCWTSSRGSARRRVGSGRALARSTSSRRRAARGWPAPERRIRLRCFIWMLSWATRTGALGAGAQGREQAPEQRLLLLEEGGPEVPQPGTARLRGGGHGPQGGHQGQQLDHPFRLGVAGQHLPVGGRRAFPQGGQAVLEHQGGGAGLAWAPVPELVEEGQEQPERSAQAGQPGRLRGPPVRGRPRPAGAGRRRPPAGFRPAAGSPQGTRPCPGPARGPGRGGDRWSERRACSQA